MEAKNMYIEVFSIKKLFIQGTVKNDAKILSIPAANKEYAYKDADITNRYISKSLDSCHLMKQFELQYINDIDRAINDSPFIIIDFEDANTAVYEKLKKINAIEFKDINGESSYYYDFLKSSSMAAKKKQIYYIKQEYREAMLERATLNIANYCPKNSNGNPQFEIPKYYSGTGLTLSSCTILPGKTLKSDEICVVKDYERWINVPSAITAISTQSLQKDIRTITTYLGRLISGKIGKDSTKELVVFELKKCLSNIKSISASAVNNKNIKDDNLFEVLNDFNEKNIDIDEIAKCDIHVLNDLKAFCIASLMSLADINKTKNGKEKVYWYLIKVENFNINTNFFDGEGLVSEKYAQEINGSLKALYEEKKIQEKEYVDNWSFQLRYGPFIKGVVHTTDLKTFFKEHNIKTIRGLSYIDGENDDYLRFNCLENKDIKYIDYDVDKIKIILTESQVKFIKPNMLTNKYAKKYGQPPIKCFFDELFQKGYELGINNVDPENNDDTIKMNREFWSTLPLSRTNNDYNQVKDALLKKTNKLIKSLSTKEYYKKCFSTEGIVENTHDIDNYSSKKNIDKMYFESDPYFFLNSEMGQKYVEDNKLNVRKDILTGKIDIYGLRRFISNDLLMLLYYVARKDMPESEELKRNNFFMNNVNPEIISHNYKGFGILRTPEYARNEICFMFHQPSFERDKYFGKLKGTIMLNPKSLASERLGGGDSDGDFCYIITDYILNRHLNAKLLEKVDGFNTYVYPLVKIPSLKRDALEFNNVTKIISWQDGFDSKIGLISNIAFKQSFTVYDERCDTKDLPNDHPNEMAFYTMISGLDIDAKKTGLLPSSYYRADIKLNNFAKALLNFKSLDIGQFKNDGSIKEFTKIKEACYDTDGRLKADNILIDLIAEYADKVFPPSVPLPNGYNDAFEYVEPSLKDVERALTKYYVLNGYIEYKDSLKNFIINQETFDDFLDERTREFAYLDVEKLKELFTFEDPKSALNLYRKEGESIIPFHYLTNDLDKINFLKQLDYVDKNFSDYLHSITSISDLSNNGGDMAYQDALRCILSFKNDGYKTLYCLIQYGLITKKFNYISLIGKTAGNVKKKAENCNLDKSVIDQLIKNASNELQKAINEFTSTKCFNINNYVNNHFNDVEISAVKAISKNQNISEDKTICYTFPNEIMAYLRGRNNDVK